jgi:hypothetical protein
VKEVVMSQYKYRDYRPGYGGTKTFMDEIWERTNARNAEFEKTITDTRREEQRLRDGVGLASANGGDNSAGGGSGGSFLFWMILFPLGVVALHFM